MAHNRNFRPYKTNLSELRMCFLIPSFQYLTARYAKNLNKTNKSFLKINLHITIIIHIFAITKTNESWQTMKNKSLKLH